MSNWIVLQFYESWESNHGLYNFWTQLWFARTKDGIDVVLKVLSDGSDPDGLRELEILRKVSTESLKSHPDNHCVPVLEFVEHGRWTFAVMPRWTGALDADFQPIHDSEEALDFCCQVTCGLAFLHENRIAHLDISQANIMINYCGPRNIRQNIRKRFPVRYGLIDFGNARMFPASWPADELLLTEAVEGHPHMAPEVQQGQPYDPFAADVFQTAVLFFSYFYDVTAYVPGFHEVLLAMAEKSLKPSDRITMAEAHRRFCELRRKTPPQSQHEMIDPKFCTYLPPRVDLDPALLRRLLLRWKQETVRSNLKFKNKGIVDDTIWNEDWPLLPDKL
ncbi:kinase-like protein [Fistulina hepatica ATCC 64428]|uniref:Kinase-like protein n=1 Tax=Fistulina hepatica ATCC 64428 TaxID=1128425 RepID=A0A0D7A291_9AGAR|nr:kinase-like protein [Fistulina hepatica ATCC 64428]